jgi:hypothetical protein
MRIEVAAISWLWFIGAWYDIFGASLLARSFLAVAPKQLVTQSSSGYGGFSAPLLRMFCEQKIDAQFAIFLLIIGLLLQAPGAALGVNSSGAAVVVLILLAPLLGSIYFYLSCRRYLIERLRCLDQRVRAAPTSRFSANDVERLTDQIAYDQTMPKAAV